MMKNLSELVGIMNTHEINEKIKLLPDYLKREIADYIDFLIKRYAAEGEKKIFSFKWEGGLKELKGQYNAVNLQHKVKDYR